MNLKLLYTAFVAVVMGTANPVYAQSPQPIYGYFYFENGQGMVGEAEDTCTRSGVVTHGTWLWGYGTNNVHVFHKADCLDGQWVPPS